MAGQVHQGLRHVGLAARTAARVGDCLECGKPRTVPAGEYRAGADGLVTRAELTPLVEPEPAVLDLEP
jgi:hypothetical protein